MISVISRLIQCIYGPVDLSIFVVLDHRNYKETSIVLVGKTDGENTHLQSTLVYAHAG